MLRNILKSLIAAWILAILSVPWITWAQGLTEAQYQALHDDILITHQAEFAADVAAAHYAAIQDAYNALAAPVFWVWRVQLAEKEIYEATSPDGTTWSWSTYKSQTVQDRDSWARMMTPGVVNPSLKNTRDGWQSIFGGQGASQAQVNFLLSLGRRQALRNEALFANTSGGNGQAATPATLTYVGSLTYNDVYFALTGVRP